MLSDECKRREFLKFKVRFVVIVEFWKTSFHLILSLCCLTSDTNISMVIIEMWTHCTVKIFITDHAIAASIFTQS